MSIIRVFYVVCATIFLIACSDPKPPASVGLTPAQKAEVSNLMDDFHTLSRALDASTTPSQNNLTVNTDKYLRLVDLMMPCELGEASGQEADVANPWTWLERTLQGINCPTEYVDRSDWRSEGNMGDIVISEFKGEKNFRSTAESISNLVKIESFSYREVYPGTSALIEADLVIQATKGLRVTGKDFTNLFAIPNFANRSNILLVRQLNFPGYQLVVSADLVVQQEVDGRQTLLSGSFYIDKQSVERAEFENVYPLAFAGIE